MSPEHFTHNTVEASFWCNVCAKPTMHNVASGRRGSCLNCIERLRNQGSLPGMESPKQPEQMTLEGTYGSIDVG